MNIYWKFWQERFKLLVDRGDGTHAERVEAYPPAVLMTDGDGPYARIRVDPGQTGFFAGREFRVFREFTLATGESLVLKFDATAVEFILQYLGVQLWDGVARFEVLTEGGTEGGTFNVIESLRRTNRMTTADLTYNAQMVVTSGGTYTGGTVTESTELDTSQGSGHHHEAANDMKPYGVPKGLYYIKITAITGPARGAMTVRWEERP